MNRPQSQALHCQLLFRGHGGSRQFPALLTPSNKGFTLIELVIAIFIFAVISVISTVILSSVLDTNEFSQQRSAKLAELQRGLLFMSRDLEQIAPRSIRDELGSSLPAVVGDEQTVEFTRNGWNNPLPGMLLRSDMQRVRYSYEEGSVMREHWLVLDRAADSTPIRTEFVPGVKSFAIRYFDASEKAWLTFWPPFDPERENELPQVLEILIDTEEYGEIRRLFGVTG